MLVQVPRDSPEHLWIHYLLDVLATKYHHCDVLATTVCLAGVLATIGLGGLATSHHFLFELHILKHRSSCHAALWPTVDALELQVSESA